MTLFYLWRPLIIILLIRHIVKFCKAILTFPAAIPLFSCSFSRRVRRRHVGEDAGEGDRAGEEGDRGGREEELRRGAQAVSFTLDFLKRVTPCGHEANVSVCHYHSLKQSILPCHRYEHAVEYFLHAIKYEAQNDKAKATIR